MDRLSVTDLAVFYFLPGFRASVRATSYTDTINAIHKAQDKRFKLMINDTCSASKKNLLIKLQQVVLQELGRKDNLLKKTKRETLHWNTCLIKKLYPTPFEEFSQYPLPPLQRFLHQDEKSASSASDEEETEERVVSIYFVNKTKCPTLEKIKKYLK
jgi:hypothetical protein